MKALFCCALLAAGPLHAQSTPVVQSPLPTDAAARVPAVRYESAFAGYRPYREQATAPWRELNDSAHQAGGHIGIFGGAAGASGKPAVHPPGHKK